MMKRQPGKVAVPSAQASGQRARMCGRLILEAIGEMQRHDLAISKRANPENSGRTSQNKFGGSRHNSCLSPAAFIDEQRETRLIARTGWVIAAAHFVPYPAIDIRKRRVALRLQVDLRDDEPICGRQRLTVELCSPDDDDFVHTASECVPASGQ